MRRILLLLFIPLSIVVSAQNRTIDSLVNCLTQHTHDSNIYKTSISLAKIYADSAYEKSLTYLGKALNAAESSRDRNKVAHIYHQIGAMYQKKGEFPLALVNFNNALEIHEFLNNKTGIGQLLNDIGLIYKTWGKYENALDNYFKALKIFDAIGDEVNGAMTSNNIGQIFYYREEYDKSISYFKKYLDINNRTNKMRAVAGAANNIASAYMELDKLDNALGFYIRSMKIYDSLGIKVGVAIIKDNIGSLYIRKKQYNDALLYSTEASKIFQEVGSQSRLCASLQCIGLAYTNLNQPVLAIQNLNRGLEIALTLKQQETKKDIYETLSEVYNKIGQYDKALLNFKLFVQIKDSLLNSETIGKIETIQAEYESQKREKDLVEVNQKLRNQRVLGLISVGVIILFLILTALIIRENQQKKKTIRLAESKTKILHQIIHKTSQNLYLINNSNINSTSVFKNSWKISSSRDNTCSCIHFTKDSYNIIAFVSTGFEVDNEEIIKLSIIDFLNSMNGLDFTISLKAQFNNYISNEPTWLYAFSKDQLVNIDFWCLNKESGQQLYSGLLSGFHINSNKELIDLSKNTNTWIKVEKDDRFFFITSNSLTTHILDEQDLFIETLSKTILKTSELTVDEQKEILNNSLELFDAGNELSQDISIEGFQL